MKKLHKKYLNLIYILPFIIAIRLITLIVILHNYTAIQIVDTKSNMEKLVIALENSIADQDLIKSKIIIQTLKEGYYYQSDFNVSYIEQINKNAEYKYINSIVSLILLCIYMYIVFKIIRKIE